MLVSGQVKGLTSSAQNHCCTNYTIFQFIANINIPVVLNEVSLFDDNIGQGETLAQMQKNKTLATFTLK